MKKGVTDKMARKKLPGLIFKTAVGNKKKKLILISIATLNPAVKFSLCGPGHAQNSSGKCSCSSH